MRLFTLGVMLAVYPALAGCVGLGAARLGVDRSDYTEQLRGSEKQQLLGNIVAVRFGDPPMFLSVASVISQYTRETSGKLTLVGRPPGGDDPNVAEGNLLFRETPTVTYTPMNGDRFVHSMLTPLPPASLLAMTEAGWGVDDVFTLGLRSIRGLRNKSRGALFGQAGDPGFAEVVSAMRRLQAAGALSTRVVVQDKRFRAEGRLRHDLTPAQQADIALLRDRLRLDGIAGGLQIVFASDEGGPGELAITTRSMLEVLQDLGEGVDVSGAGSFAADAPIRIHGGPAAPPHAHVAIRRAGRWYWIADDDAASKRTFLLVQVMLSLNDDAAKPAAPLITVPAG